MWTQEEREVTYITPEDPSSEICGEVAAAFAASSLAMRDTNPEYGPLSNMQSALLHHIKSKTWIFIAYSACKKVPRYRSALRQLGYVPMY